MCISLLSDCYNQTRAHRHCLRATSFAAMPTSFALPSGIRKNDAVSAKDFRAGSFKSSSSRTTCSTQPEIGRSRNRSLSLITSHFFFTSTPLVRRVSICSGRSSARISSRVSRIVFSLTASSRASCTLFEMKITVVSHKSCHGGDP